MGFSVDVSSSDAAVVITPVGDIDMATAPEVQDKLLEVLREAPSVVVVDLHKVTFLDSSGLAVLVAANRRAQLMGSRLRIAGPRAAARKVLGITGLDKTLAVYDDVEAALRESAGDGRSQSAAEPTPASDDVDPGDSQSEENLPAS